MPHFFFRITSQLILNDEFNLTWHVFIFRFIYIYPIALNTYDKNIDNRNIDQIYMKWYLYLYLLYHRIILFIEHRHHLSCKNMQQQPELAFTWLDMQVLLYRIPFIWIKSIEPPASCAQVDYATRNSPCRFRTVTRLHQCLRSYPEEDVCNIYYKVSQAGMPDISC